MPVSYSRKSIKIIQGEGAVKVFLSFVAAFNAMACVVENEYIGRPDPFCEFIKFFKDYCLEFIPSDFAAGLHRICFCRIL